MIKTNCYRWINLEKSRYYSIVVTEKSNSCFELNHAWGGCYSNRGGKKDISMNSQDTQRYLEYMIRRRKARGYKLLQQPTVH